MEEPAAEEPAASPAPAAKGMQKTTVSAGTSITGTISSDGHVEMLGEMKGDIDAKGNVRICGQVTGNVQGNTIDQGAVIHGALKVLRDKEIEKAFENL